MRFEIKEYGASFVIECTANTIQDAALLTRMGMNGKKEVRYETNVYQDGTFTSWISIHKNRRAKSEVPKRR